MSIVPFLFLVPVVIAAIWFLGGITIVHGQTAAIVEAFGKPMPAAKMAGLCYVLPWPFNVVVARVDLRQQEIRKELEIKTSDDAFVKLPISIQLHVVDNSITVVKAYYKFQDPSSQIASYVMNTVRTVASTMTLQELYSNRDRIAAAVIGELSAKLNSVGYHLDTVLVNQPMPSDEIQAAYNRVLAANRLRQAAEQEAEAERIKRVGLARAEAESKKLQGEGIAAQRTAIAQGLKQAMETMKEAIPGADETMIMALMLATNQMDMITTASQNKATTILLPYGAAGTVTDMNALVAALRASARPEPHETA